MSDWAAYINKGGAVKIVGSQEFFTSAAAMPAFEAAYGFKLKSSQVVALATGDTAATEKAASQGTSGANAAMAYGTDGTISALDLVVLTDPKGAQPIYQPAPTVRKAIADKYPELATLLDPVFEKLTLETLQKLNGQVAVDGKDPKTVATDWLKSQGLLK
jgi:osmoprotectant transport system substrate-binding protein